MRTLKRLHYQIIYPVSGLLCKFMIENHLSTAGLAEKMGYTNINRGVRRIRQCLEEGVTNPYFTERLVSPAGMDKATLMKALADTRSEKKRLARESREKVESEARLSFRPHLYALTSSARPLSITAYALLGGDGLRIIPLPEDIVNASPEKQLQVIKEFIAAYRNRFHDAIPLLGPLTGFIFQYNFDEGMELSIGGEILSEKTGKRPENRCRTMFGKKKFTFPLSDH